MSDRGNHLEIREISAPLRANCPMQDKWISVKGKRNSCTFCRYLYKIRFTDWGAVVECKYKEGQPPANFEPSRRSERSSPHESGES